MPYDTTDLRSQLAGPGTPRPRAPTGRPSTSSSCSSNRTRSPPRLPVVVRPQPDLLRRLHRRRGRRAARRATTSPTSTSCCFPPRPRPAAVARPVLGRERGRRGIDGDGGVVPAGGERGRGRRPAASSCGSSRRRPGPRRAVPQRRRLRGARPERRGLLSRGPTRPPGTASRVYRLDDITPEPTPASAGSCGAAR